MKAKIVAGLLTLLFIVIVPVSTLLFPVAVACFILVGLVGILALFVYCVLAEIVGYYLK